MGSEDIHYSEKYFDDKYEYRHVLLPPKILKIVPRSHLLSESEWRNIGVQQSPGWVHYMSHHPDPHVLLFRRLKSEQPSEIFDLSNLHLVTINAENES